MDLSKGTERGFENMTPQEFANEMRELTRGAHSTGDSEAFHAYADTLMCKLLTELGYGEGVEWFEQTEKWYS